MDPTLLWTLGSVVVVSLISLIGAASLMGGLLTRHRVLMALVALAAGTLIGDAFLHILPEAAAEHGFSSGLALYVVGGFVVMFVLEVVLRWNHAHIEDLEHVGDLHGHPEGHHIKPFGYLNLVGDGVHNLLDGIIIGAAYAIDVPLGIATTIAVVAHEIPQELGDFAVLLRSGMKPAKALLLNLGSALLAVIGALVVLFAGIDIEVLEGVALPLIAGAFLYIAAADLIPELHHHSRGKDAFIILAALLVGIAIMAALLGLEGLEAFGGDDGHAHG